MILKQEGIELNTLEITTLLASCRTNNPSLQNMLVEMQAWVNEKAKEELKKDKKMNELADGNMNKKLD